MVLMGQSLMGKRNTETLAPSLIILTLVLIERQS